ncbi:MAG TPA: NTP transferase domain-containing protein [Euzebyales bacterium]|nr:NTP transferase domain-containing protein [Euzebyales bacterium]
MADSPDDAVAPAGLLLAAGGGRRLGRPKALVEFHGEPLVRRGIRLLRRGGCAPVTVVVGAAAAEVRHAVGRDAGVVHNANWTSGMGGSLRAGLSALDHAPAVVVALVDQPLVGPAAVRLLVDAWRGGAVIAVASYGDRPRNPVLFDAGAFAAARDSAAGDAGARALLRAHPDWVQRVPCDAVASPRDIDTADDLRTLLQEPDPNPGSDRDRPKEPPWS